VEGSEIPAPDWLAVFAVWLETSPVGVEMRTSPFLYPLVNIVHLLGLVLIVGGIGLLDLRLLGFARRLPLDALYPLLTGAAMAGVLVQIASGIPLFASDAVPLLGNQAFQLKMLLFAAALANVTLFRLLWRRRLSHWDEAPPITGQAQAALSLMLWLAIGGLGRMIAYL
jgi:hypothetical protein